MIDPNTEIARLYVYSPFEQKTFPYLRRYMDLVSPRLDAVLADPARRRRFMLAGLLLAYRAANHHGQVMTTTARADAFEDERLTAFPRLAGEEIQNAAHYLHLLGRVPWTLPFPGLGARLFRFVWRG
ncbi:hypothetical protein [Caulobacter segnis]|uniref:Uncharacterized protein n=1 Tax=Caulobacter segnis TaxID=88688 RepID=A0A2W5VHD9_9CAUL|nr:hypothetical protein [Caulobacter segnis]PZR34755.1 MAG: hypothetical protein DI526_09485 [Caulobacter segnis]